MAAAPYSPQWVCEGPTDALSVLRVLKARVYAEPAPSGSSARVMWSLDHVCSAIPAAAGGRVTKCLQRAGAPSSRYKFCLLHGLREFDWLPSLLSKDGRVAAKRERSLRAGDDARCGTKYMLALLLMWSHRLRKEGQEAAKCILEDILRKVEGCLPGREFPVAEWAPELRTAGRASSSPETGGCDAEPLAAQSVGVPLSAEGRADAAHLATLMLALEEKDTGLPELNRLAASPSRLCFGEHRGLRDRGEHGHGRGMTTSRRSLQIFAAKPASAVACTPMSWRKQSKQSVTSLRGRRGRCKTRAARRSDSACALLRAARTRTS